MAAVVGLCASLGLAVAGCPSNGLLTGGVDLETAGDGVAGVGDVAGGDVAGRGAPDEPNATSPAGDGGSPSDVNGAADAPPPGDIGSPTSPPNLLFRSHFSPNVVVINGTAEHPAINGADLTVASNNSWSSITSYIPWAQGRSIWSMGGSLAIVNDLVDPGNKVLRIRNHKQSPDGKPNCRTQIQLGSGGGGAGFQHECWRYRLFLPTALRDAYPQGVQTKWFMLFEIHASKSGDEPRYAVRIERKKNQSFWTWEIVEEYPEQNETWENSGWKQVPVPFGEWFWFDVYFKYHATNGVFHVTIQRSGQTRQTVALYQGKTKYGKAFTNVHWIKCYHHSEYLQKVAGGAVETFIDDVEIWDGPCPK
jgi:hypothetical protein